MRRRLILVAVIILTIAVLSGCTMEQVKKPDNDQKMFLRYQRFGSGSVLVDRTTRVMYWISEGKDNCGSLTLLVNPDGSPKVWEGNLDDL